LGLPLFVPAVWQDDETAIKTIESDFWKPDAGQKHRERFQRFVDALLDNEQAGVAQLQQLAGDQPAAFVLHVRDIILLGQMAPDRIGVAFRDFPNTGDVHTMVRSVRGWMKAHDYYAYAGIKGSQHTVRAVALTDAASGKTLAARLLPFIGNDRGTVAGTVLVYSTGGLWGYQLGVTPRGAAVNGWYRISGSRSRLAARCNWRAPMAAARPHCCGPWPDCRRRCTAALHGRARTFGSAGMSSARLCSTSVMTTAWNPS